MNVTGAGAPRAHDIQAEFTSPGASLAALMVEAEADAAQHANEDLEATKQRIARAADAEYKASLRAADAGFTAALVQGGFTIAGGGMSAYAAHDPAGSQELAVTGRTVSELAKPAGELAGGREQAREAAAAQRHGRTGQQLEVEAQKLQDQAARAQRRAEKALDHGQQVIEAEAARSTAVLSNY